MSEALYTLGDVRVRVCGARAAAVIQERSVRRVHERRNWHLDDFVARVAFADGSGQPTEALVSMARSAWSRSLVGGSIAIVYDPAQPSVAVPADHLGQVDRDLLTRAVCGVPLLLLAVWLRIRARRTRGA